MKRIVLFALALSIGFGFTLRAQDESDTSKIRIGKKKYTIIVDEGKDVRIITDDDPGIIIEDKHKPYHKRRSSRMNGTWRGFEFGLTNFVNADKKMTLPVDADYMKLKLANSWGLNFNFAEKSLGLIGNYFGLVTGLGIEYQRYMFDNNVDLVMTDDGITGVESDLDYYKNRLSVAHLTLPLMAEIQIPVTGEHNRIKLSAGVVGGLRIGSRQVQKYMINDEKQKILSKDDFFLRDFRYGFTARAGYGDLILFANYYPQTLFKAGTGPEIFPITFGIHFGS